ncbi:MAG: hypothetical protein H6662_18660 [Ardenticatenaceae bacterium]|nr:hypothetical protein [Anaerolineales bacterium]MCB8923613.1 hypothetical protein [Ardenticatenaceae bacterium]
MNVIVQPVQTAHERKTFLTFPWRIYKNDPLWVPPLLRTRDKVTDPQRGVFFRRGEAEFFVAWANGRPVGTLCAAEDKATNARKNRRDCVIGFLDYIPDHAVFSALIDTACQWAKARQLDTLFGPFDLDYDDAYGVLVDGRDRPPTLMCGHTPPYYQQYMEEAGFKPARKDNVAFALDFTNTTQLERLARLGQRSRRRGEIVLRAVNFDDWDREIDRILHLMETAMAHIPGHIGWRRDTLETAVKPFRNIADPELILFAEVKGEAVGWLPGVPNLNEALIHANGLRYPWDYAKLWWHMRQQPHCLAIKAIAVLPEYWGTAVPIYMFDELIQRARAKGYTWGDLSITSEDNPTTPGLAKQLGATLYKRWRVYHLPIT